MSFSYSVAKNPGSHLSRAEADVVLQMGLVKRPYKDR